MHFIDIGNGKILDFDKVQTIHKDSSSGYMRLFVQDYEHYETVISKEEFEVVFKLCSKKIVRFKNLSDSWTDTPYYINVNKILLVQKDSHTGVPGSNKKVTYIMMSNGMWFTMENDKYKEIVRKM